MSESPEGIKLVLRKTAPSEPALERTQAAWKEFQQSWRNAPEVSRGNCEVYGKRVSRAAKKELAKQAAKVLAEHFSVFEMARILQDPTYGLEAYMATLREIRDDRQMSTPKDRMLAADKIMQTTLSVLKANDKEEPAPDSLSTQDIETTRNLTAVLVDMRKELPDGRGAIVEPALPQLTHEEVEADVE